MPAMCACGYTREDVAGIWVCEDHCDTGVCEGGCERCRTYSLVTGKRASA